MPTVKLGLDVITCNPASDTRGLRSPWAGQPQRQTRLLVHRKKLSQGKRHQVIEDTVCLPPAFTYLNTLMYAPHHTCTQHITCIYIYTVQHRYTYTCHTHVHNHTRILNVSHSHTFIQPTSHTHTAHIHNIYTYACTHQCIHNTSHMCTSTCTHSLLFRVPELCRQASLHLRASLPVP